MDYNQAALKAHAKWKGKLETTPKMAIKTIDDLSIAYTPGVAAPCLAIQKDPALAYTYTQKANTVAVITDGSAVLGLGNIGPCASLPVMEGKCVLFKQMANVDAVPIALDTQDTQALIEIISALAVNYGGINLEDISAPRCFEIEEALKKRLSIPIFHDDQHGTAIVTCAALLNALKVVKKTQPRIVISGAGAAGLAITKLILAMKLGQVTLCNSKGVIQQATSPSMADIFGQLEQRGKTLAEALEGADVLIGVSAGHIVSQEMVASMASDAIVLAMANPIPEIEPDQALAAGARIVGTGRSDHPNQINNLLAFPGLFRGALDAHATTINEAMKLAAVYALAGLIENPSPSRIIVSPLEEGISTIVASAVYQAAIESGVGHA